MTASMPFQFDRERLLSLAEDYSSASLAPSELAELESLLLAHGGARELFGEYLQFDVALANCAQCENALHALLEYLDGERFATPGFDSPAADLSAVSSGHTGEIGANENLSPANGKLAPSERRGELQAGLGGDSRNRDLRSWKWAVLSAAAIVIVALAVVSQIPLMSKFGFIVQAPPPIEELPNDAIAGRIAQLATLLRADDDAEWEEGYRAIHPGMRFVSNQELRLLSGTIEIEFDNGARVLLHGPAHFAFRSPALAEMKLGKLLAVVPPAASGFSIDAGNTRIVDKGTEFGVSVDEKGEVEIHVFEGKVETSPRGGENTVRSFPKSEVRELLAGSALVIPADGGAPRALSAADHQFAFGEGAAPRKLLLLDNFTEPALDESTWTTVVDPEAGRSVDAMAKAVRLVNRGYLVVRQPFDARRYAGGIEVAANWVVGDHPQDSLSIGFRGDGLPQGEGREERERNYFVPNRGISCDVYKAGGRLLIREYSPDAGNRVLASVGDTQFRILPRRTYRVRAIDDGSAIHFHIHEVGNPANRLSLSAESDRHEGNRVMLFNQSIAGAVSYLTQVSIAGLGAESPANDPSAPGETLPDR